MSTGRLTNGMNEAGAAGGVAVSLEARPERRLIRPSGGFRHVDFWVRVGPGVGRAGAARLPLSLALVLDRSGSMAGEKLRTAKRAARAVLERLDERDRAAVVVFDDRIDLLQAAEPVTASLKARVGEALGAVEARASTALHEGWLSGCRAIAGESTPTGGPARCFLLTDGLANVGVTDPEQIASEAAGIREQAGVGTSTFGIGPDYDELLLGPLAAAGGGQFHNLRTAAEIAATFVGELGGLLALAATGVRLELAADPGVRAEIVSGYHGRTDGAGGMGWSATIGDLIGGEERHVVVRFGFPPGDGSVRAAVRGRLRWTADGAKQATDWQEICFTYADHQACDAEPRDPGVMHWVGLHHADRARYEATVRNRRGDLGGAQRRLQEVGRRIAEYAGDDAELGEALAELRGLEYDLASAPVEPMVAKELIAESYRRSWGQADHRDPPEA